MGSTNPAKEENRRQVVARDFLSNTLPSSQGGVVRSDGRSGLALSGRTTTARGHIIVPPTKARLIAFEYEHVPDRNSSENNTPPHSDGHSDVDTEEQYSRTVTLVMSGRSISSNLQTVSGEAVPDSPSPKVRRAGVARNEFSNTGQSEIYHTNTSDGSQRVCNANKTTSTEADKSAHRVDRNDRSVTAAPTLGAVTGTNSEVPSRIVALREEYEVKKQQADTKKSLNLNRTQRGIATSGDASQGKTGRRRRARQSAQFNEQLEPSSKQSNSTGKPVTGFNALGNANPRRKYSPYPAYIQPVIEENSSYRGPSNLMPYQSRSYAAQRSRKISTEMNRYESSSSSSSSSSESDRESPNRPVTKKAIDRVIQARNLTPETPDTSDAEKQKPGLRRRRRVRTLGAPTNSKQEDSNNHHLTTPSAKESSGRGRAVSRAHGGMGRTRQHNVIPPLEDKYVSLPDNYKPSEFYTAVNSAGDGDIAQLVKGTNSQSAVREERSNVVSRLTCSKSECDTGLEAGSRSVKVDIESASSAGIPVGLRRKSDLSSPTNVDQLIITKDEKVGHRRALSTSTSREISHGVNRIPQQSDRQGHADFTLSTPELPNSVEDGSHPPEDHKDIGRGRKNSIGGETKHLGDLRSKFETNDVPKGDAGQSYVKPFLQHSAVDDRTGRGSLRNEYQDAPGAVQRQPRLTARKVSQSYWPLDENTKRLLSHPTTPLSSSTSSASVTMQETIDQLHNFANEETPIKSRSNSITALSDYSRTYESDKSTADLTSQHEIPKVGRKSANNHRSGGVSLSRVQMVKTTPMDASSPCMSSTETLKECSSSGELHDKNSRSPSIDSTASNPEAIGHNVSGIKDRNTRAKVVYAGHSTPITDELFIVEQGQDLAQLSHQSSYDPLGEKNNGKLSSNSPSKTMAEQFNSLTDTLKKIMRPRSLCITPFEKATLRQDAVLTVSPKGSVTCQPPKLETVTEHPDYLEIDEGIVTEVETNKDPKSFLKLDEHLEESNKRRKKRTPPPKDLDSNGNESARSLSDPSADRKRSLPGPSSVDSNLLSALGKNEDMGSFEHASCSSSSHFSENPSSYSDTLNIEEISEDRESDETGKNQTPKVAKKKSKSDPSPEGFVDRSEVITKPEESVIQAASSEPSMEQTDKLGDLDHFKNYKSTKVFSAKPPYIAEEICTADNANKHPHVYPRKPTMKSKIRQMNGANSFIGKLIAESASPVGYDYNRETTVYEMHTRSSSTSSPSEESSPVQKQGPGPGLIEPETEKQFFNLYDSMTSKSSSGFPEPRPHPPIVHTRSNSEPVHKMEVPGQVRTASESYQEPYGNGGRGRGMSPAPSLTSVGGIPDVYHHQTFHHSHSEDPVFSPIQERRMFSPIQERRKAGHDMRLHAFENLRDTEESYVSSLRILYEDYMTPLKHPENHSTCEPRLVDEMFYKIPQLYQHHKKFYEEVKRCYDDWNNKEVRLGELFLNAFNENALLETYTAYITNYLNAREAVRNAREKEAFRRFIEQCRAGNKEKQGLADLMIKPVQRIPRYELLIKDMLKHTPEDHPDREGLLTAKEEINKLAVHMDRSEKEAELAEKQDRVLTELEEVIDGLVDLCVPKRRFLRQDIVTEIKGQTKRDEKDRSIWLFSDLIVCSTRKGRTGTFRRGSTWNLNIGQDKYPSIDNGYKYKFLWKFPLEDVNTENSSVSGRQAVDKQLQTLQNDMDILLNMQKQATQVECNHVQLEESLREIIAHVGQQIAEKKQISIQPICPSGRVELSISTGDGMKAFLFEFLSDDNKVQFEKLFSNAKRNLTTFKNRWEPTFTKAIPISRTRAGMQFSCAASNVDASPDVKEVWVCNTDGYVGQVCFLTLEPEPSQTQCITVCHAKICCITQVPAWERRLVPAQKLIREVAGTIIQSAAAVNIMSWDDPLSDEDNTSPHSTMSSQNSSANQSPYCTLNGENMTSPDIASLPGFESGLGAAWLKSSDGSTLHGSLEDLLGASGTVVGDAQTILAGKDSMWLGTEDGKIHIYPSSQSTRGSKHCVRVRHSAAVHCILYHEGQVFVALSNGDLVIYTRSKTTGEWDFQNGKTKAKISSPYAITKMVVVLERKELWCGCQNLVKIVAIEDLTRADVAVTDLVVANDNKRQIYCMVNCGYGVWVALDKRPQIKLYHTATHELLADIDVSTPVSKMLASADAIIRQHKAACLRITALLVCNDLLWVGTSAGVVLTLTLPKIAAHTSALAMPVIPQGLAYGHTGHVRFLTCAQLPEKEQHNLSRGGSRRASTSTSKRRSSSGSNAPNPSRTISVIISGGDGYEDFRMNSASQSAGRDDSTNHLLVWRA